MVARVIAPDRIREAAVRYIEEAPWNEMHLKSFARTMPVSSNTIIKAMSPDRWRDLMAVERQARVNRLVASLEAQHMPVSAAVLRRRLGLGASTQVRQYRLAPRLRPGTQRERLESAIDEVLEHAAYREDATVLAVRRAAGSDLTRHPDLSAEFWRRRQALPRRPRRVVDPAVALDPKDGGPAFLRARLRPDIADLMWDRLIAEVGQPGRAVTATRRRFHSLRSAGQLLGIAVPDVRAIDVESMQRAWLIDRSRHGVRKRGRQALLEILDTLVLRGHEGAAQAADWLSEAAMREPRRTERALSAAESDSLVAACLESIAAGREEVDLAPNLGPRSRPGTAEWGLALVILIGRFTGLRTESLTGLRIDDLLAVGPDTHALLWRHGKKLEERLAFIPASLALLLREYDEALRPLRESYGIETLFVGTGRGSSWTGFGRQGMAQRLLGFTRRRLPAWDASDTRLSALLLRRTFATRSLAEGRSIYAIAAQLGHTSIATTLGYVRFERHAHPDEVAPALDRFGRVVLDRWKRPSMLGELEPGERDVLERDATTHGCGVGLCRHDRCAFVEAPGTPPPCQACEFLATGPSFFPAWELDLDRRRARIAALGAEAALSTVAAAEAAQLAEIERIYRDLRDRA